MVMMYLYEDSIPNVSRDAPGSALQPVGNPMVFPSSGGPSAILMPEGGGGRERDNEKESMGEVGSEMS